MTPSQSVIFQSAKLGDVPIVLEELRWADKLLSEQTPIGRIYGLSGGALAALAFGLVLSARLAPADWSAAKPALADLNAFLASARWWNLRGLNLNPKYGPSNLNPLRRWITQQLRVYSGREHLLLSDLPVPVYLAAADQEGTFTLFGPPDKRLKCLYQFVPIGPPQDAPVVDALIAALSTMLSTEPAHVNGCWYRDCRPMVVDAGALVADLEAADPRLILRTRPHTYLLDWKANWFTSSFIMHSYHERNQPLLASYYLDLLARHRALEAAFHQIPAPVCQESVHPDLDSHQAASAPGQHHIQLPYVGSTEAFTNMRDSVAHKTELMDKFRKLLDGQVDAIPFDQPANLIYGAGGFSGILGGLVTSRVVDEGFSQGGGQLQQIYGVSAGVLNGFFHAVQVAAQRYPDLYRPAAHSALNDLEAFIGSISRKKFSRGNRNPLRFWRGWSNLAPLEGFIIDRLAAYTGSRYPEQIRFDDIGLPLTVTVTRRDGFSGFLGMSETGRQMLFAGQQVNVRPARVARAIVAGWSMNTYVEPADVDGEIYEDGGGAFYDIALFAACMDPQLTNLINIHLDEPEGHSYHLPPRPDLVKIVFDTHNYTFPEERRRMFLLSNLLYSHYALRAEFAARQNEFAFSLPPLPPDFRQEWTPIEPYREDL
jgi:hypothetical protein